MAPPDNKIKYRQNANLVFWKLKLELPIYYIIYAIR